MVSLHWPDAPRIRRLRDTMPDESPIDLDAHAERIVLQVQRAEYAHAARRRTVDERTIKVQLFKVEGPKGKRGDPQ